MVRSKGKDGSIIRYGHSKRGVPTSTHGHLAIELKNIPYLSLSSGSGVGSHHPSLAPPIHSSSTPTTHHTSPSPVQSSSARTIHAQVQSTPDLSVQSTPDIAVHPTPAAFDHDLSSEEVQRDASGRVIIRPLGKGWTPNHHAIEAIGYSIRSQFMGPYHHYEAVHEEVKLKWWIEFKTRVTWAPHDEGPIRKIYESKVRKRLCDMLSKARTKGSKPSWIGVQVWDELLNYWNTQKFKEKSFRNKMNRSSARGGALHSTGRKSHLDIALDLERKYGRPIEPDELFLATHTNKKGGWVDSRSRETYETYHEQLRAIQSNSSEGSTSHVHRINAATKLQCWKDVAGGKRRGRVYGTADLADNIRQGMSSLTQPSLLAHTTDHIDRLNENKRLRQEVQQAFQEAKAANEKASQLEETLKLMQQQLAMMMERERQIDDTSTGTSRVQPHYAEDFDQSFT